MKRNDEEFGDEEICKGCLYSILTAMVIISGVLYIAICLAKHTNL